MSENSFNTAMILIDKSYNIMYANETFRKLYPQARLGKACYKSLYGLDAPCDHCLVKVGEPCENIDLPCDYSLYLKKLLEKIPVDEQQKMYGKNNIEFFTEQFHNGILKWQMEYDVRTEKKKEIHVRRHYTLTENEDTGDIYVLVVARDITKEYQQRMENEYLLKKQKKELSLALQKAEQRLKIIKGLCDEYTAVFYVDARTNKCSPYLLNQFDDVDLPLKKLKEYDFSDLMEKFISNHIIHSEKQEVFHKLSLDVVSEELEKNNFYAVNYCIQYGEKKEHFQTRIIKIDDKYEQIWAFRSVEAIVLEEYKQQNELQKALEVAQRAERAKTQFLLNMSHDIRTPMNAIIGFNTLAQNNINNKEKILDSLKKAELASQHLLNLINDVLEMARIESGKMEMNHELTSVNDHFEEIKEMFTSLFKERQITFLSKNDYTIPYIYTDGMRITQVIANLLGNAIKFTKPGGTVGYFSKEVAITDDGFVEYEIKIQDTGIGMGKEFQAKLFDAFERERSATESGVVGSGLGLSIAKRVATLLGGSLSCESELGKGTTFTFMLKAKIADEQAVNSAMDKKESKEEIKFFNKRILLVEDNELNCEIAKKLLEGRGLIVETAGDGAIAVDMVKNSSPGYFDLIFMDIQMPYMDGYVATKEIRQLQNKELAQIPIVAMTANAFSSDKEMAIKAGMNEHLAKPIDMNKVVEMIQKFVK